MPRVEIERQTLLDAHAVIAGLVDACQAGIKECDTDCIDCQLWLDAQATMVRLLMAAGEEVAQ